MTLFRRLRCKNQPNKRTKQELLVPHHESAHLQQHVMEGLQRVQRVLLSEGALHAIAVEAHVPLRQRRDELDEVRRDVVQLVN